jgi:hypothetical protein
LLKYKIKGGLTMANTDTLLKVEVKTSLPSESRTSQTDYRESMAKLPGFMQGLLTWITGKPLKGDLLPTKTPTYHLAMVLATLIGGILLSIFAMLFQGLWLLLLLPGWIFTVSGARQLQVVIVHHCAHGNFTRNRSLDRRLGQIISAILLFREFDGYQQDHIKHHADPSAVEDETVKFLRLLLGIQEGMSVQKQWRRLWFSLVSPIFHFQFLVARLVSSLGSTSITHRVLTWSFLIIVLTVVTLSGSWRMFLIVWVFPLTVLYQISTTLRLCSEHLRLPALRSNIRRDKQSYSQATVGIFLGDPVPDYTMPFWGQLQHWCGWWLRLMLIHIPTRVFVLVGDCPHHDYHHRHPNGNWANATVARQQNIDAGCPGWNEPYREVVGFWASVELAFQSISQQEPVVITPTDEPIHKLYTLSAEEG